MEWKAPPTLVYGKFVEAVQLPHRPNVDPRNHEESLMPEIRTDNGHPNGDFEKPNATPNQN